MVDHSLILTDTPTGVYSAKGAGLTPIDMTGVIFILASNSRRQRIDLTLGQSPFHALALHPYTRGLACRRDCEFYLARSSQIQVGIVKIDFWEG